MQHSLIAYRSELHALTRRDPSPQVQHPAHLLEAMLDAPTWEKAAVHAGTSQRYLDCLQSMPIRLWPLGVA